MTTLNLIITTGTDDADETGGAVVSNSNALIRMLTGTYWAGLRFTGATIPNAATINTAVLTVYVDSTTYDDPGGLTIYGNAIDTSVTFGTTASEISGRARTTANAVWSGTALGVGDENSPDLAAVIQEIVNRAGWVSGNALTLLLDGGASTAFRWNGYETSSATCARLAIDYTAGAAATSLVPLKRTRTYLRL